MAATEPSPGSWPNGQLGDGQSRPQSAIVGPVLEGLRARARESISLSKWSSVDTILDEATKSNIHVNTGLGFGRRDQAYLEWLKCEEYIKLLMQHSTYNSLNDERKRRIVDIQRIHEEQRARIKEIEAILGTGTALKSSNGTTRSSTLMQPGSRNAIYGDVAAHQQNGTPASHRYTYDGRGANPSLNGGFNASASRAEQSTVNGNARRGSTRAEPVPPSLAVGKTEDPLMERFSQLRSPTSRAAPSEQAKASIPNSLRAGPSTARVSGEVGMSSPGRPAGPRSMPPKEINKELPSTPPQLSVTELLDSLPRAPSPIYSPTATAQNSGNAVVQGTSLGYVGARAPLAREKPPFPDLKDPNAITPEQLFDLMKSYKVLLIDVRPRDAFDEGHIHSRSILCIEPIVLKAGQSLEQLEATLLYGPDDEISQVSRITEFDLVVYYDRRTSKNAFLNGPPSISSSPHMRYLYDTLTEFNWGQELQRPPAYLIGGIEGWVELVGPNALQSANTASSSSKVIPQRRRTSRASIIGANSSREIRAHRLAAYNPLNADEERQWLEKVKTEELAPADIRQFAKQIDGDSVTSQSSDELFLPIQNMDDFFRRYPDPSQMRESMTSPTPSSTSSGYSSTSAARQQQPPPQYVPPTAPAPIMPIPSRPPPIASRPSYSGVSERRPSGQATAQASAQKSRPPIYQSRSLAHTLKLPRTGLKNFGVTCYMNSTIQCLNATMPLSRFFLDETWRQFVRKNWKGSNGIMPEIFATLIRGLWRNESASVRPTSFRNFCNRLNSDWGSGKQQDSKEFLEFLIDTLHEDFNDNFNRTALRPLSEVEEAHREELGRRQMNRVSKREWDRYSHRERSYVSSLFAGQHASQLRCTTCQKTSTTYEAFYSISVEIPRTGTGDIRACLQSYCKEEQLSGNEEWRCPNCKCTRVATKRIMITRLPQILVIHFKRFSASKTETARKVHTPIDFPLHGLDMQPYMANTYIEPGPEDYADPSITPPFQYDCYAVMRHLGQGGNAGHYIAICRDAARGCWREYNDDIINDFDPAKLKSKEQLQNGQAYILFYERAAPR